MHYASVQSSLNQFNCVHRDIRKDVAAMQDMQAEEARQMLPQIERRLESEAAAIEQQVSPVLEKSYRKTRQQVSVVS